MISQVETLVETGELTLEQLTRAKDQKKIELQRETKMIELELGNERTKMNNLEQKNNMINEDL